MSRQIFVNYLGYHTPTQLRKECDDLFLIVPGKASKKQMIEIICNAYKHLFAEGK